MFAPDPIPASVVQAFDKANKYRSRVSAGGMRPMDLAIIAAIGMSQPEPTVESIAVPAAVSQAEPVIDPTEPDADVPDPAPQASPETQTMPAPSSGPTGVMDAPATPSKERRARSAYLMQKMTVPELKVHARAVYGFKPGTRKKKDIIKALKNMEPL
jgi:hypothetical protein